MLDHVIGVGGGEGRDRAELRSEVTEDHELAAWPPVSIIWLHVSRALGVHVVVQCFSGRIYVAARHAPEINYADFNSYTTKEVLGSCRGLPNSVKSIFSSG